jgi:hypothetical protein
MSGRAARRAIWFCCKCQLRLQIPHSAGREFPPPGRHRRMEQSGEANPSSATSEAVPPLYRRTECPWVVKNSPTRSPSRHRSDSGQRRPFVAAHVAAQSIGLGRIGRLGIAPDIPRKGTGFKIER